MATFEAQVNGLTGLGGTLSGSTTPTDDELDQFLKDGVIDVTSKHLSIRPQDDFLFMRASSEVTSQGGTSASSAKIINVVRESGTNDDWRNCRRITVGQQSNVTDTNSLHYASAYNPAFLVSEDGAVLVYPVPSSGGLNSYKVYSVNGEPRDQTNNAALAHTHSDIKYFPEDKVYLVVIYAAIKSLEAKLASYTIDEEDSELVRALQVSLQQLQISYNSGFLPDKNYEAALKSQSERRAQPA